MSGNGTVPDKDLPCGFRYPNKAACNVMGRFHYMVTSHEFVAGTPVKVARKRKPPSPAIKACVNCGQAKYKHRKTGLGADLCPKQFRLRDLSQPFSSFIYCAPQRITQNA